MGRFVPNRGFEQQISASLDMRNLQDHVGKRAAGAVRQSAPTGPTGQYRRSIRSDVVLEDGRWTARVGSSDWAWHMVEFGSANNPIYAPLRRGLEKVVRRTKRFGR